MVQKNKKREAIFDEVTGVIEGKIRNM